MKQTPDLDRIEHQMQPGVISLDGFLGTDRRRLQDILIDDDAAVKRLDRTHTEIAARMRELREEGKRGLGEEIRAEPHIEVRVDSVRGKLPCPFLDGVIVPKVNTTVQNLELGREVTFTDLNIHMIEAHGFYEGKGSPFRLDPESLAGILF